ncbi:MAG TPA: IS200/IS605 family transposase [Longimicrobiaceae bacterium]|nr:IS200/IS605 family transposase [Longimicrobiaceae bacterium]
MKPYTQLFVHLVWATWDRAPLLEPGLRPVMEAAIRRECVKLGVEVVAFGAMADHVHLLVRLPTTISVASLVQQVKGSTSHLVNQELKVPFKWQGRYGAFTVSKPALPRAREYVLNQEQHHREGTAHPSVELD